MQLLAGWQQQRGAATILLLRLLRLLLLLLLRLLRLAAFAPLFASAAKPS
jgi:hypothetical protein